VYESAVRGHQAPLTRQALKRVMSKKTVRPQRLIFRIDLGPSGRIGLGTLLLLEHIHKLGSISAAGRSLGIGFRQAWAQVRRLNEMSTEPVDRRQTGGKNGGGAVLTDYGLTLMKQLQAVRRASNRARAKHIEAIGEGLRLADQDLALRPLAPARLNP
jgi:molybdate transport system regulatory protein